MKAKKIVLGVAVSTCALFVVFLVLEFLLHYFPAVDNSYPNSSKWYRAKWFDSHRDGNAKFYYAIDEYHNVYGWVLKSCLQNFTVKDYSVSSDKNHFRSIESSAEEDSAKVRILVLGDSFTFGECVNDSETYPAQLQQITEDCKVMNAGVHGWGNDQMLLRLRHEGQMHNPQIVLIGCFNDNLLRNHLRFRDYAKPYFVLEADSLVLQGVPVPSPQELLSDFHLKFFDFVSSRLAFTDKIVRFRCVVRKDSSSNYKGLPENGCHSGICVFTLGY